MAKDRLERRERDKKKKTLGIGRLHLSEQTPRSLNSSSRLLNATLDHANLLTYTETKQLNGILPH